MATLTYGAPGKPWSSEVDKAANYQVTGADSGTFFTQSLITTFTLPALVDGVGCYYWFYNNTNANMLITAPTGKLIMDGSATATTCTYSTSSHKIGSCCFVFMNAAGTFYNLINIGGTTAAAS